MFTNGIKIPLWTTCNTFRPKLDVFIKIRTPVLNIVIFADLISTFHHLSVRFYRKLSILSQIFSLISADFNRFLKKWKCIGTSFTFPHKLSKHIRILVNIVMVMIGEVRVTLFWEHNGFTTVSASLVTTNKCYLIM